RDILLDNVQNMAYLFYITIYEILEAENQIGKTRAKLINIILTPSIYTTSCCHHTKHFLYHALHTNKKWKAGVRLHHAHLYLQQTGPNYATTKSMYIVNCFDLFQY
ncbi:hypothetical protein ACJX0J_038103, partial [Zea mays]